MIIVISRGTIKKITQIYIKNNDKRIRRMVYQKVYNKLVMKKQKNKK